MRSIYIITVVYGLQFALLHVLAEFFELYWRYEWLDIPMHIFGGILLMLIIGSLITMRILPYRFFETWRLPLVLALVLGGWELFGIMRYSGLKSGFWFDTSLDLLCGTVGLALGHSIVTSLRKVG